METTSSAVPHLTDTTVELCCSWESGLDYEMGRHGHLYDGMFAGACVPSSAHLFLPGAFD